MQSDVLSIKHCTVNRNPIQLLNKCFYQVAEVCTCVKCDRSPQLMQCFFGLFQQVITGGSIRSSLVKYEH